MTTFDRWYARRPVLVLGGFGFIGINLCRRLLQSGAVVTVVARDRSAHAEAAAEVEALGASVVLADRLDAAAIARVVSGQSVVFDMAGRSGAVRSMEDPFTDLDTNCRGTLVLLDALRRVQTPPKVVFPGSRLVYGSPAALPVTEDAPLDPLCVHAAHKIAIEQYLRIYGRHYGLRFTILRVTNPYGPGQPAGRTAYGIVNRMIHLALQDQPLPVFGDGLQRRDYIFISDLVDAMMDAGAEPATDGGTYNVGSGVATSFVDMAQAVVVAAGGGRVVFEAWPALEGQVETGDFVADVSKLERDVGWKPATSLADGLRDTVDAYRAHAKV